MNRLLASIVLPLLIVAAGWRVAHQFRAAQIARAPVTPEGLLRAIELDPEEPTYHFRLGVAHRDLPELQDPRRAKAYLESAAALNPFNWRYQRELAQLYELSGQTRDAEAAFLRAVELSPRNGAYRWRLANFYLRHRALDKAVPELELALAADRALREPTLGLLLRAGGSYRQVDRVWPRDREARWQLLRLLCRRQPASGEPVRDDFLGELWDTLLTDAEPPPLADGQVYVDLLIRAGRFDRARERWLELTGSHGLSDRAFELGHNSIWNGDFEQRLTQVGLDWDLRPGEGYTASVAEGEGEGASRSLRVAFDGSQNLSFSGVRQRVIVEPGRSYRLSFRARAQDLSTDQGVFFEVRDGSSGRRVVATEALLGTMPWTTFSAAFVAPGPRLRVFLSRGASLRFDSRLSGVLWIDAVKLEVASS